VRRFPKAVRNDRELRLKKGAKKILKRVPMVFRASIFTSRLASIEATPPKGNPEQASHLRTHSLVIYLIAT